MLLGGDALLDFLVDRDEGLAFHLAVGVTQVRGAVLVTDNAVERDPRGVADPQAAAHQDDGEQPAAGVVPAVEVGGLLDLGHDVLGQPAGQALFRPGEVVGVEGRAGGQAGVPLVPADRVEEGAQGADVAAAGPDRAGVGGQVGQVALQDRPVDAGQARDVHRR
jgi:hypothetical protein